MGKGDDLDPEEWCSLRVRNRLEPIMTDLPPAPEALLEVVRCTCRHDCDTRRCSYKKHRLDCCVACGECKGITSCNNSPMLPVVLDRVDVWTWTCFSGAPVHQRCHVRSTAKQDNVSSPIPIGNWSMSY